MDIPALRPNAALTFGHPAADSPGDSLSGVLLGATLAGNLGVIPGDPVVVYGGGNTAVEALRSLSSRCQGELRQEVKLALVDADHTAN